MQNKHTDNKTDDRSKPRAHVERHTALDKALSVVLTAALVLTMSPLGDAYAAGGPSADAVPQDAAQDVTGGGLVNSGLSEDGSSADEPSAQASPDAAGEGAAPGFEAEADGALPEAPTAFATWLDVARGVEDGTLAEEGFKPAGTGSEDDPYTISTPEAFAWWALLHSDASAKLEADIDLTAQAPAAVQGESPRPVDAAWPGGTVLAATLDGQGRTLCFATASAGLFQEITQTGRIEWLQLGLTDAQMAAEGARATCVAATGAQAGALAAVNKGSIQGVVNRMSVQACAPAADGTEAESDLEALAGGIVAVNDGTIEDCANLGAVINRQQTSASAGIAAAGAGTIKTSYGAGAIDAAGKAAYLAAPGADAEAYARQVDAASAYLAADEGASYTGAFDERDGALSATDLEAASQRLNAGREGDDAVWRTGGAADGATCGFPEPAEPVNLKAGREPGVNLKSETVETSPVEPAPDAEPTPSDTAPAKQVSSWDVPGQESYDYSLYVTDTADGSGRQLALASLAPLADMSAEEAAAALLPKQVVVTLAAEPANGAAQGGADESAPSDEAAANAASPDEGAAPPEPSLSGDAVDTTPERSILDTGRALSAGPLTLEGTAMTLDVAWESADYDQKSVATQGATFTAKLPQGYELAEGAMPLSIRIASGEAATMANPTYADWGDVGEAIANAATAAGKGLASGETVSVIKADGTAKDVVLPTYDTNAGGLQIGTAEQLALFTYLNEGTSRKMQTSSIDASKQNRQLSAVLTADIDLTGTEYSQTSGTPLAWTPIVTTQHGEVSANYAGTFDGQGHTISNLTKTGSVTGQSGWGLFGFVSAGGTVKNVLLKDVNINVTSDDYLTVGGIASQLTGGAVVESCGVLSGTIGKDPTANRLTGGIVGDLYIGGGTIKNCFSNATMLGNQSGGILGRSISTGTHTLENCYFTGVATNAMIAARTATTSVTNCYSTSDATLDAGTKITSDQLKTWGAAYQLNGGATGGTGATGNVADMATWRMDDPANPKNGGFPVLCAAGETMDKASDWQDVGEWVESFNPNDVNGQAMKPAGDGADATPFLISTPEALAWLGIEVEAHNRNHKISATLLGDIDLAGTRYGGSIDESAATAEAKYHNALPWIPIGRTVAFGGGTFNGQNFTIEHMNAAAYEDVSYAFSGLFAKTDGAVLRDVSLRSGVVLMENLGESNLYVGSLAGVIDSGTNVVNCVNESVDVVVRGHEADDAEIGGLVGSVQSSSLYGCRNEGNVTTNEPSRDANGFAGGIAGGADAGKMLLCFNSGTLTSTGYPEADGLGCMYVGGILGGAPGRSAKTQIIQCGNIGSVAPTGASYAAGIVSLVSWDASDTNLQIASNYSAGPIGVAASEDPSKVYAICPNYIASLGGVSMNAYCTVNTDVLVAYELNDANFGNILGKTTAEMQGSALLSDLNIKLYAYTGTDDPKAPSGDLLYNIYEWTNAPDHNGYPIPSLKASSSAYADWGTVGTAIRAKQTDLTAGSATISAGLADPLGNSPTTLVPQVQKEADGTLLISTPEQLAWFQASIDADSGTWAGKNVKLTADLDLSGTKYGGKVNSTATTDKDKYANCLPWMPIGGTNDTSATATPAKAYTGTFDGGRHAITNLAPVKRGYHVGLFGIAHNATLRGVNVASGYIAGVDRAAGVVARITGITTVEDCSNAATVYSDPSNAGGSGVACNTGGVVGCAYMGDTFYIRRCSNTGDVRAIRDAGGVIGSTNCTNPGIIEDSYNTGNITATANSGGYGTGGVIGTGGNVSRMARCYNAGDVNGSKKGALSDSFTSGATVESCYYDGSKAGATGSGTSLTSDQLKTWGTAYQLNGGATGGTQSGNVAGMTTWTFAPDSYPQLIARNADGSPAATMQKASDWGQVGGWVEDFCTATDAGETAGFRPNLSTNNGTAADKPITLTTPEALAWYAYKLNTAPTDFRNHHVRQRAREAVRALGRHRPDG